MKRRKFLKNVSLGTAASVVIPNLIKGSKSVNELNIDNNSISSGNDDSQFVEKFSKSNTVRSGLALGGIGTGSIELRKDGRFYNWSVFNNYPKETGPRFIQIPNAHEDPAASNLFFIVRYEVEGKKPKMKLLQITDGINEGAMDGIIYYFPWLDAIESIEYKARFPFVNIKFTDEEMPFDIELEAYSPFIPHDVKNSSLPLINFDFKITSKTNKKIDVMIIATLRNLVGYDTNDKYFITGIEKKDKFLSCNMTCGGMDKKASSFGEMVLSSLNPNSTYYSGWEHRHPYYEYILRHKTLPNIDDTNGTTDMKNIPEWLPVTNGRNKLDAKTGKKVVADQNDPRLFSSLAYSSKLNYKSDEFHHSFLFSWNFPNLYAEMVGNKKEDIIEGHYYSNFFNSGLEVAEYGVKNKSELYKKSKKFVDDFFDSSIPVFVLEQINSQLNTFITSGRFVKDGWFGIQEGLSPSKSWGPVATIDVALYGSIPTLLLFPELQKSMMRAHKNIQRKNGQIAHGLYKNFSQFEDNTADVSNRIDLPSQYIIMVLRDYFWTNDKDYLREMWPSVKKAMNYVLNNLDLNKDLMPDMEGTRSSYDNFPMYGLASYTQSLWLAAMTSVNKVSNEIGDKEAESISKKIIDNGKGLMEKYLWNGEYYRLYNDYDNKINNNSKIDDGCLTDQMIGQWSAHFSALGYLLEEGNIKTALQKILKMSFDPNTGLRNASWPGTKWWNDVPPNIWNDQGNTSWTGVELAFASFLIYEGMYDEGLKIIESVNKRYRKAGLYWDHQEFGGHYYRAMSAWAILNAVAGFQINKDTLYFSPKLRQKKQKLFLITTTGTFNFLRDEKRILLKQLSGKLIFKNIIIPSSYASTRAIELNKTVIDCNVTTKKGNTIISLIEPIQLSHDDIFIIS